MRCERVWAIADNTFKERNKAKIKDSVANFSSRIGFFCQQNRIRKITYIVNKSHGKTRHIVHTFYDSLKLSVLYSKKSIYKPITKREKAITEEFRRLQKKIVGRTGFMSDVRAILMERLELSLKDVLSTAVYYCFNFGGSNPFTILYGQ